mmetsp:Transcript_44927/g.114882  ORF Transcript_44927/g.114882 Transcript_44927/m.114882 type:complete len:309 (+) Transcript_44927:785-1711(+)
MRPHELHAGVAMFDARLVRVAVISAHVKAALLEVALVVHVIVGVGVACGPRGASLLALRDLHVLHDPLVWVFASHVLLEGELRLSCVWPRHTPILWVILPSVIRQGGVAAIVIRVRLCLAARALTRIFGGHAIAVGLHRRPRPLPTALQVLHLVDAKGLARAEVIGIDGRSEHSPGEVRRAGSAPVHPAGGNKAPQVGGGHVWQRHQHGRRWRRRWRRGPCRRWWGRHAAGAAEHRQELPFLKQLRLAVALRKLVRTQLELAKRIILVQWQPVLLIEAAVLAAPGCQAGHKRPARLPAVLVVLILYIG